MEQQLPTGLAERQVAEFIDDDEIVAQQLLGQAATASGGLLLFELVDEIDEVEEAAPGARSDDGCGYADAEMGLTGADAADEDGVTPVVEERAGCGCAISRNRRWLCGSKNGSIAMAAAGRRRPS